MTKYQFPCHQRSDHKFFRNWSTLPTYIKHDTYLPNWSNYVAKNSRTRLTNLREPQPVGMLKAPRGEAYQSKKWLARNTQLRLGPTAVRQPHQPGYAQPRLLLIRTRHFIRACAVCLPCAASSTGRGSCTMAAPHRAIGPRGPFYCCLFTPRDPSFWLLFEQWASRHSVLDSVSSLPKEVKTLEG